MKESAVASFDERAIYKGVKEFGDGPWKANAADRARGYPKIIPEMYREIKNGNLEWPEYRNFLFVKGVRDPAFPRNPPYCSYGDSTRVPVE